MKDPEDIAILFHNEESFDFHYIVKGQIKVCAEAREEEKLQRPTKKSKSSSSTDPPETDDSEEEDL